MAFNPITTNRLLSAAIACLLLFFLKAVAVEPVVVTVVEGRAAQGADGWVVQGGPATLLVKLPGGLPAAARFEATLVPALGQTPVFLTLLPDEDAGSAVAGKSAAAAHLRLERDKEGRRLTAKIYRWQPENRRWSWQKGEPTANYTYSPAPKKTLVPQVPAVDGGEPERSWVGRPLPLRIDLADGRLAVWLDGRFVTAGTFSVAAATATLLALRLGEGDRLANPEITPVGGDAWRFLSLDLANLANGRGLALPPAAGGGVEVGGVPFCPAAGRGDHVDLRPAGWIDQERDPAKFVSDYDGGAPVLHDERMPMLRVPRRDYAAMHLLAVADDDAGSVPRFTLRAGIYGGRDQVVQHDFPAEVPVAGASGAALTAADGRGLHHVRLPMSLAFAQDIESDWLDLELTREVRLAVRRPDANRFQYRPLGLPSGVRIVAATLEVSPLQIRVTSAATGHAFQEPQIPAFEVVLTNVSAADRQFRLQGRALPLAGDSVQAAHTGTVPAGGELRVPLVLPIGRGYAEVEIDLLDAGGELLLRRRTAMCLLPPAERRQHRHLSPFGTWDFGGMHFTGDDPDVLGPLYVKLGLRFGMAAFPPAALARYGLYYNSEANVHFGLEHPRGMRRRQNQGDRALPYAQVFHETSISGPHSSRVPDLFHDRPAYQLNEAEKKRFAEMWEQATALVDETRKAYPGLHFRFGNGPIAVREEFYRHKLPPDKFDSAGNESAAFGRLPEAQPPDIAAMNAALWMDRQLLDHYGYKDKPVTLNFEVIYPSTNPGNLDERTQADYMVRHALHALAWGMEHIRPGAISDVGNSYYFSNWGASGFTRARPEFSVKPAFVAFATMSLALDGAKFTRLHDTGSLSVYALEFQRPDGDQVYALWTVRGRRPLTIRFAEPPAAATLIDNQGRETGLNAASGAVPVTLSPAPSYLRVRGGKFAEFALGAPDHRDAEPAANAKVAEIANLGVADGWSTVSEPNHMLEHYNDKTAPRRRGNFIFEPVAEFAGVKHVLRVTPRPLTTGKVTMPAYMERRHAAGIELPGRPTHLAVRVHGNSGWGRIIFSLTDAAGQVWTQIGAAQTGEISPWLLDWMPAELVDSVKLAGLEDWNTNDVFGDSRINFDGWRLVAVPLPGQYPGEPGKQYHWPRSGQWHCTGDGVVHYPLKLTRVIVELNEKTLHVSRYEPPARPEICLGGVLAIDAGEPLPRNSNPSSQRGRWPQPKSGSVSGSESVSPVPAIRFR